jgi:hypothetical protein
LLYGMAKAMPYKDLAAVYQNPRDRSSAEKVPVPTYQSGLGLYIYWRFIISMRSYRVPVSLDWIATDCLGYDS